MIFIYNTTSHPVALRAKKVSDLVVLELVVTDLDVHSIISTAKEEDTKELSTALLSQYGGDGYIMEGEIARRNLPVEGKIMFYDAENDHYIQVNRDDLVRRKELNNYPRNIIMVVTSEQGKVEVSRSNLSKTPTVTEVGEGDSAIKITKLYVKWSNWAGLKFPMSVTVTDGDKKKSLHTSSNTVNYLKAADYDEEAEKKLTKKPEKKKPAGHTKPKTGFKPNNNRPSNNVKTGGYRNSYNKDDKPTSGYKKDGQRSSYGKRTENNTGSSYSRRPSNNEGYRSSNDGYKKNESYGAKKYNSNGTRSNTSGTRSYNSYNTGSTSNDGTTTGGYKGKHYDPNYKKNRTSGETTSSPYRTTTNERGGKTYTSYHKENSRSSYNSYNSR